MIQLFNGCFFLWANIASYVLSYFFKWNPKIGQGFIFYVDLALVVLCVTGYQIGTYMLEQKQMNPKVIILIGGSTAITGIFLSSLTKQIW